MKFITTYFSGEGIGGQFSRFITAKYLASLYGLTYIHRPFEGEDWDNFLGFGTGEIPINKLKIRNKINVPFFDMRKDNQIDLSKVFTQNYTLYTLHKWAFFPPPPDYENKLVEALRIKYKHKTLLTSCFNKGKKKTSVIVRRGEISRILAYKAKRWVPIEWYVQIIQKLKNTFQNLDIHVYSDAETEKDIQELSLISIDNIHLKKEDKNQPYNAFNAMVESDIIVCGLTGFCWVAGLLSEGLKILPLNLSKEVYFSKGSQWIENF